MFIIEQTIDLRRANPPMIYGQALEYGDKKAHKWRVRITSGGAAADLSGMTALLTFKRAAGPSELAQDPDIRAATVEYAAEVDAQAGVVSAEFDAACYGGVGNAAATIKLMRGERVVTSAVLIMQIARNTTDAVIDPTNLLPSIEELLAQMGVMQEATDAANEAAQAASGVVDHAPIIGENGTWLTWDYDEDAYADTGVAATGPAGENGSTPYIGDNGNWFVGGVDTGVKAQGPAGANGTGAGTVTGVTVGGVTYEPDESGVVDLGGGGVPDGGTTGQMLFKTSDEDGAAEWQTPTAQMVGALSSDPSEDGTDQEISSVPINADQLGGMTWQTIVDTLYPIGAVYTTFSDTDDPNAKFSWQTWAKVPGRMIIGTGTPESNDDGTSAGSYNLATGATGGEATHTLTEEENARHQHASISVDGNPDYKLLYDTEELITTNAGVVDVTRASFGRNDIKTEYSGASKPHNNMPPYIAANIWRRTA